MTRQFRPGYFSILINIINMEKDRMFYLGVMLWVVKTLTHLQGFLIYPMTCVLWGFPGGSDGKESTCSAEDLGLIPRLGKIPWGRAWQPSSVFSPGESPWTEELGGLQSLGSQRLRHNWATNSLLGSSVHGDSPGKNIGVGRWVGHD